MSATTDPDPKLKSVLASGVRLVISHGVEAGHDRARIARSVAEAFRNAVSCVVAGDGRVDPEASMAECEAMEAGTIDYPTLGMAEVMRVSLQETGLDLTDLMAQESAWAAIQALCAAQLPPA